MKGFFYSASIIILIFTLYVYFGDKNTNHIKPPLINNSIIKDTVFLNLIDSTHIIYTYEIINGNKILRNIVKNKKNDQVLRYQKFKVVQEVSFNQEGDFFKIYNVRNIKNNLENGDVLYDYDVFKLDEKSLRSKIVYLSDDYIPILNLFTFNNKLLDMNVEGNNGVAVYDYITKEPEFVQIQSLTDK